MVVPVDADEDEAQGVGRDVRQSRQNRAELAALRGTQLQHHDRDDDGEHAVAEGFDTVGLGGESHHGRSRGAAIAWLMMQSVSAAIRTSGHPPAVPHAVPGWAEAITCTAPTAWPSTSSLRPL